MVNCTPHDDQKPRLAAIPASHCHITPRFRIRRWPKPLLSCCYTLFYSSALIHCVSGLTSSSIGYRSTKNHISHARIPTASHPQHHAPGSFAIWAKKPIINDINPKNARINMQSSTSTLSSSRKESRFRIRKRLKSKFLKENTDLSLEEPLRKAKGAKSRIRSVLAKAKDRTGIENKSHKTASALAEAASIGGFLIEEAEQVESRNTINGERVNGLEAPSFNDLDVFEAQSYNETRVITSSPDLSQLSESYSEIDAFKGDVSAAFSMPASPLPFTLPELTEDQNRQLLLGERIEFQSDMGREGSGFVVVDVNAPSSVVWDCLLDFHSYPETIPTVRGVTMYTNTHLKEDYFNEEPVKYEDGTFATLKHGVPSVTRASFSLSKFKLKIAAIHKYRPHPQGDYMIFTLDPACTNIVLKSAKGIWHTQDNPEGKQGSTRVWLLCELQVSKLLPEFIVNYASKRAMPRATTWLKPQVEAAASLWLKPQDNTKNEG